MLTAGRVCAADPRGVPEEEIHMRLQESGEMYLETILILSRTKNFVRSIDVCEYMGYSKPSISRAVSLLRNDGYVNMDERGYLLLTEKGLAVAEKIYERHQVYITIMKPTTSTTTIPSSTRAATRASTPSSPM